MKIRFAFPKGSDFYAKLRFPARANQYYAVRFETFPHAPGRLFTKYEDAGEGNIIAVPAWLAYNVAAQGIYKAKERAMTVEWTHIDVISADPSEGRVARVRVP